MIFLESQYPFLLRNTNSSTDYYSRPSARDDYPLIAFLFTTLSIVNN
jgi:hypothetical protein